MSFEDLKSLIKKYYIYHAPEATVATKVRVREQVVDAYRREHGHLKWLTWRHWIMRFSAFSMMAFVGLSFLGIVEAPFLSNQMVAGTIKSNSGVVEVIRGNESFLVKDELEVRVGDIVKIGHRGNAILVTDSLISKAQEGTEFKVEARDELFVVRGALQGENLGVTQIKTERASIMGERGSGVEVVVSSTGETTVHPLEKTVQVVDLHSGKLIAEKGDVITLRSDTRLREVEIPEGISLSNAQIESILGKLAITRTKVLTGIEKSSHGERVAANRDILSAEKTYLSVVAVLGSSRDLSFVPKKNLDQILLGEVYEQLAAKTDRVDVLTETKALEAVFMVLSQNKNSLAFAPVDTGVEAFDRYVLLNYLASLGEPHQEEIIQYLADNYVIGLLRKIQNEPVKIDQIAMLKNTVDELPVNDASQKFLLRLEDMLAPDLAKILSEKIDSLF